MAHPCRRQRLRQRNAIVTIVITHFPSPYQVELFDEIERQRPGWLKAIYLFRAVSNRNWKSLRPLHEHEFLGAGAVRAAVGKDIAAADFVVFNYYNDARASQLIRTRAATGRPWCFWGERPGYRYPWLARVARLGRLGALRAGQQPIWGIGSWAVSEYRKEFGLARQYLNLPYYSNLDRFQVRRPEYGADGFRFLFSGALTHRKGVDLLAHAFRRLADESPRVRLTLMGEGEMKPRLQRMLADTDRVTWLGFKDWSDLPAVYASAQVLCVPSRHDGWGLVVPEGLAAGLPVIGTDRTGAALDLIQPGDNGWMIRTGDADALYNAMHTAAGLTEPEWRAMSDRARTAVQGHSLAAGARRFLDGVEAAVREAAVQA